MESTLRIPCLLFICVLSTYATHVHANEALGNIDAHDQQVMASRAFMSAHPDMKHRTEGLFAYEDDRFDDALKHFTKAAEFADKPSQAMLAEMAWKGIGQPQDRPRAYAWADLAAERGYRQFVAQRESYWADLTPEERIVAIDTGQAILEKYGDASAQKRLARHLRDARRWMISKRPRKDLTVVVPGPHGLPIRIAGHDFYADKFWNAEQYFVWTDEVWMDPPTGRVDIGPIEQIKSSEQLPASEKPRR